MSEYFVKREYPKFKPKQSGLYIHSTGGTFYFDEKTHNWYYYKGSRKMDDPDHWLEPISIQENVSAKEILKKHIGTNGIYGEDFTDFHIIKAMKEYTLSKAKSVTNISREQLMPTTREMAIKSLKDWIHPLEGNQVFTDKEIIFIIDNLKKRRLY